MGWGIWCFLWCRRLGGCDGKGSGQGRWRCLPWGRWVLGEAGGVQPGNPCGLPRLYGRTPYENNGWSAERAIRCSRSERKDRRESELFLRSFLSLLFAPPTGATRLYTPSDSHQLLLLLLCLLLWPTRQVIDLCAYRL